jgi:hypothetical protein
MTRGPTEKQQAAVQKIYDRDGQVTTSAVLDAARYKRNPLYSWFEWDDSVAAREYRLDQARRLCRSVTIVRSGKSEVLVHVPIEIGGFGEGFYQVPSVIVKTQSHLDRALSQALSFLAAAEEKVRTLIDAGNGGQELKRASRQLSNAKKNLETARSS